MKYDKMIAVNKAESEQKMVEEGRKFRVYEQVRHWP